MAEITVERIARAARKLGFELKWDPEGGLELRGKGCSLYADTTGRFVSTRQSGLAGALRIDRLYAELVS